MSDPESQTLRQEINSLSNKIDLKDRDATALMQIVIQTNKDVSNNLVKLTEVVSNVTVLERTQEAQQAALNKISERVADNETDIKLVFLLESIRERFKKPVKITSASRCPEHNKASNGVKTSKHLQGIACDIQIKDVKPYDIYCFVDDYSPNHYGVGLYDSFTHIDVRKTKARWRG